MVGELYAGLGALKAMLDTVKSLKDLSDTAGRNRVTIELTEKIIAAQETQTALLERVQERERLTQPATGHASYHKPKKQQGPRKGLALTHASR